MPEPRDPESVPRGLVLFAPGTAPGHRRRRLVYLAMFLAACVSLVWPVYPLFAGPRPFVLGLPLPLAWILLWMAVNFGALIWLYRSEPPEPETTAPRDESPANPPHAKTADPA